MQPVVVFTTTGPSATNALTGGKSGAVGVQETVADAIPAGLFHLAATLG